MKSLLNMIVFCAITSAQSQNPDSSGFYFRKAMTEKSQHLFLVAARDFDKAISFDPTNTDAMLQNGYTHLEMKSMEKAMNYFLNVHSLEPENKLVNKELMELYYCFHQYAKAIEFAEASPDCLNSKRILGLCYYQTEDYAQAEKYLAAALVKDPSDAEVTYTMGRNYLDMEEYHKAVPFYEKAIKLNESRSTWIYELGLLYYNLEDYKNALGSFKNAADHGYAQSNDFKENLGFASLYSGEDEAGEQLLLATWKRKPANKDILRDMAEIFYKRKKYDKSLEYCQKLMEIDMKDGKALYQAGLCFQKKGEKDRGEKMCDKAIELDPTLEPLRRKKETVGL